MKPLGSFIVFLIALLILAACRTAETDVLATSDRDASGKNAIGSIQGQAFVTPTLMSTASPTASSTPTITPFPTPTPTPTALPVLVYGDPRAAALVALPPSQEGSCDLIDILDFPLNPPHGDGVARGGSDFGIYRGRYDAYHAGEDWWLQRGGSSLGAPVYSIGNGRITYADPTGWGRDQGVVIVRHTYPSGESILSFYGHLDPPSIVLSPGDCVSRGQKVGEIGRPRTPPHLHFEIRSHMPDKPGTGYWAEDPTVAGWLAPSMTIWEQRLSASPGVQWTRPPVDGGTQTIGVLNEHSVIVIEDDQLLGIDADDGTLRWQYQTLNRVDSALIDSRHGTVYVADQLGRIEAFASNDDAIDGPEVSREPSIAPKWSIDLDVVGIPNLMPLPGGGIVLSAWDDLVAVSADGALLWEADSAGRMLDWTLSEGFLVLSTVGGTSSLWAINGVEHYAWTQALSGKLTTDGDSFWLYNPQGIYTLDPVTLSAELLFELPRGYISLGDIVTVNGIVLIAHADASDRRLIALNSDGTLRWHLSYANSDVIKDNISLFVTGTEAYLMAEESEGSSVTVSLFAIDVDQDNVVHFFTGGTRRALSEYTSIFAVDDERILLKIGGGHMAMIVVNQATKAVLVLGQQTEEEANLVQP